MNQRTLLPLIIQYVSDIENERRNGENDMVLRDVIMILPNTSNYVTL
jgi:hypothetical protein